MVPQSEEDYYSDKEEDDESTRENINGSEMEQGPVVLRRSTRIPKPNPKYYNDEMLATN